MSNKKRYQEAFFNITNVVHTDTYTDIQTRTADYHSGRSLCHDENSRKFHTCGSDRLGWDGRNARPSSFSSPSFSRG